MSVSEWQQDQQTQYASPGGRRTRWTILFIICLCLCALAYSTLNALFLRTASIQTPDRAAFLASTIDNSLNRLAHLPFVLSEMPKVLEALMTDSNDTLNPFLEAVAERSGAEFIFVMDINGRTLSSSNYRSPSSLVGEYYTFRPYFQAALTGRSGRFFAVGATTGRPGYFMAEAVRDAAGTIFGVMVVKINLGEVSRSWTNDGELVLVTNPEGVILASSDEALIFNLIRPLTAFARRAIEDQQQFGDHPLSLVDWRPLQGDRVRLNGRAFLWSTTHVSTEDWTIHVLSDVRGIYARSALVLTAIIAVVLVFAIAATLFRSARLRQALAVSNADRARLITEIEERRLAETRLHDAQEALTRKNRLAALGELSASITHELGQPISAMRNYLVAEEIATNSVPGQLAQPLHRLIDRMQRILDQLRSFARPAAQSAQNFLIADAVQSALSLMQHDASKLGITISSDLEDGLMLHGDQPKLEQVIINLLRNAFDAVENSEVREVTINLNRSGDMGQLLIQDTGVGIGSFDISQLQEPFFTTKPSGRGMGLGLAISSQIIDDFGGRIEARETAGGGATFTIHLPLIERMDG